MFNEYDVVTLKNDLSAVNSHVSTRGIVDIPAGTEGTIVLVYPGGSYEVEFFDDEGNTLALSTVTEDDIQLAPGDLS